MPSIASITSNLRQVSLYQVLMFLGLMTLITCGYIAANPPQQPEPGQTPPAVVQTPPKPIITIYPDVFTAIKPTVIKDPLIGLTIVTIGGKKYSYVKMPGNHAEIFTPQDE